VELYHGKLSSYNITNPATKRYLQRVGRQGQTVTVDVGMDRERNYLGLGRQRQRHGQRGTIWKDSGSDLGRLSHILYLASPVLTITSIIFLILLQECKSDSILVLAAAAKDRC
jgi:hypothetical protein